VKAISDGLHRRTSSYLGTVTVRLPLVDRIDASEELRTDLLLRLPAEMEQRRKDREKKLAKKRGELVRG
jgi:hypothetical protein